MYLRSEIRVTGTPRFSCQLRPLIDTSLPLSHSGHEISLLQGAPSRRNSHSHPPTFSLGGAPHPAVPLCCPPPQLTGPRQLPSTPAPTQAPSRLPPVTRTRTRTRTDTRTHKLFSRDTRRPCKRRDNISPRSSRIPPLTRVDPNHNLASRQPSSSFFPHAHSIPHPAPLPVALSKDARCTDIPARTNAGTEGGTGGMKVVVDMEEEVVEDTGATRRPLVRRRRGSIRRSTSSRPRATSSRRRVTRRRLTSTSTACLTTAVCPSPPTLTTASSSPFCSQTSSRAPTNTPQTPTRAPTPTHAPPPAPRPRPQPTSRTLATAPPRATPSSTLPARAGARPS